MAMVRKPTVLLIVTLDTKGAEAAYMKEIMEANGCSVLVMNPGILAPPQYPADIDRDRIAEAGGVPLEELLSVENKGRCIETMISGVRTLTRKLFGEGRFEGIVSIGGAQGTDIGTAAMRELPFGVPKFMVSTVATGLATFGTYIGTKDIIMMHSVADIQGLNRVTRSVLRKAAISVCAMLQNADDETPDGKDRIPVAMSMLGTTTPGAMRVKDILEHQGFEVVAFHQNGSGGIAMEDMIREGLFRGVLDLNLHEIGDRVAGGLHGAIRDYRLESAGRLGIPQVVAPGSIYYTVQGPYDSLSEEMKRRKLIVHNPHLTLVRLSLNEIEETARITARKLNAATGPVHLFLPLRGMAYPDREGLPHWDPEGDELFYHTLKQNLDSGVPVSELDAHINDPEFIDPVVEQFLALVRKTGLKMQSRIQ